MTWEPFDSLTRRWRKKAEDLRRYGADTQARAVEQCAEELEEAWRRWQREALTVEEAAEECGYTADHLRRLVRQDKLPKTGDGNEVRIRRRNLPRKPGQRGARGRSSEPASDSRTRVARTVVDSD